MKTNKGMSKIAGLQLLTLLPVALVTVMMLLWLVSTRQELQHSHQQEQAQQQHQRMQLLLTEHFQLHHQMAQQLSETPWAQQQMLSVASRQRAGQLMAEQMPWVRAAYLVAADQLLSRDDPGFEQLSYREITAIQQTIQGLDTHPELLMRDNNSVIYWSLPVAHDSGVILGAMHLVLDSQWMMASLARQSEPFGTLAIVQQFPGSQPQDILRTGQMSQPQTLQLPHPFWRVEFSPTVRQPNLAPLANLGLQALLLLAVVALISQLLAVQFINRWYRLDLQRLSSWMQRFVLGQKTELTDLHLPIIDDVRQQVEMSLTRDDKRISESDDLTYDAQKLAKADSEMDDLLLDSVLSMEPSPPLSLNTAKPVPLRDQVVRFADLRGIVGVDIDDYVAESLARAFASEMIEQGQFKVVLAHDNRPSSPGLQAALVRGFTKQGLQVIDLGMQPLPVMHFYMHMQQLGAAIMITASQSAAEFNGFKCYLQHDAVIGMSLQALWRRLVNHDFVSHDGHGSVQKINPQADYIKHLVSQLRVKRLFKVVVNCSAGVSAKIVRDLFSAMDAKVILINDHYEANKPLATQPAHPLNITRLADEVRRTGADFGLGFDPDADQLVVVDNQGQWLRNDLLLQLLAKDHLRRQPEATIVFDARCSQRLPSGIKSFAGKPVIGHTEIHLLRKTMQQEQASLAGDSAGHLIFPLDWHSHPDALYAAARIMQLLSLTDQELVQWAAIWPVDQRTPEWRLPVAAQQKHQLIADFENALSQVSGAQLTRLADSLRLDFEQGWFLMRPSLFADELCLCFEAEDEQRLLQLQRLLSEQFALLSPKTVLPF